MMYAHVTGTTVDTIGQPPRLVLQGDQWIDLRTLDPELLALAGWYPLVLADRPADTSTTTSTMSYEFDGDSVQQVWTPRPKTAAELESDAAEAAAQALREEVKLIKTDLQAEKARVQIVIDKPNNQITGADTKDVARAAKRIADAAISIAKLLDGA